MIILDEKEYAKERIKKNDIGDNPYTTINILARYYFHELGLKKKKISEMLIEFLNGTYPRYASNKSTWVNTIESTLKNVAKYPLFESSGVWITTNELDKIAELETVNLKKLAFGFLCLAKYMNQRSDKNDYWTNTEIKEVFDMVGIKCSTKTRALLIGKLIKLGYIKFADKIYNLNIKVLFADEDSDKKLRVFDFRNLGNEYLYYNGGNFVRCAECGLLVENNKNKTKKYCDKCGTYTPLKTKIISCVDCGKAVIVSGSNKRTLRCSECQAIYNKERNKNRNKYKQ